VLHDKIQKVTHEEVIQNAELIKEKFSKLLLETIKEI